MDNKLLTKEMFFGLVDGKHEFNEVDEETFARAYFIPENISVEDLIGGSNFIILGPRGSGKTTLLRWIFHSVRYDRISDFLLFKSEISEREKQDVSRIAGISEISLDGSDKGVFQDFRDLWRIIIFTRLSSMIVSNSQGVEDIGPAKTILKIGGLDGSSALGTNVFQHLLSIMRLKWTDVASGIEWESGLWGIPPAASERLTPNILSAVMGGIFKSIRFLRPYLLLIDELEIFYKTQEQFKRDCDIIRDSIAVCEEMRQFFKKNNMAASIIIAIRNEVVESIGARGEEIYKIVDDYSVKIDWSARRSTPEHPLIRMIFKKIPSKFPDKEFDRSIVFPEKIFNTPYYQYLSDNTACKPRNIVSMLNVVKNAFPNEYSFTEDMFKATAAEYSSRVWKETEYLLGASHSELAVRGLKRVLFAWRGRFRIDEFVRQAEIKKKYYPKEIDALLMEGYVSMFERMFEYGVVGNVYKDKFLNRSMYIWSFRKEDIFQPDRDIEIQRSLWSHLSIVTAFTSMDRTDPAR